MPLPDLWLMGSFSLWSSDTQTFKVWSLGNLEQNISHAWASKHSSVYYYSAKSDTYNVPMNRCARKLFESKASSPPPDFFPHPHTASIFIPKSPGTVVIGVVVYVLFTALWNRLTLQYKLSKIILSHLFDHCFLETWHIVGAQQMFLQWVMEPVVSAEAMSS